AGDGAIDPFMGKQQRAANVRTDAGLQQRLTHFVKIIEGDEFVESGDNNSHFEWISPQPGDRVWNRPCTPAIPVQPVRAPAIRRPSTCAGPMRVRLPPIRRPAVRKSIDDAPADVCRRTAATPQPL